MRLPEVISMGTLLVEGIRLNPDEPLNQSGTFAGPLLGDDTPVYNDPVARLNYATAGQLSSNPVKPKYFAKVQRLQPAWLQSGYCSVGDFSPLGGSK